MKYIIIKTIFNAKHCWADAPEEQKYLREYHPHMFGVEISIEVGHPDREVEFFAFKDQVDAYINGMFTDRKFDHSVETIAEMIGDYFKIVGYRILQVEVSEDGINAGGIEYER